MLEHIMAFLTGISEVQEIDAPRCAALLLSAGFLPVLHKTYTHTLSSMRGKHQLVHIATGILGLLAGCAQAGTIEEVLEADMARIVVGILSKEDKEFNAPLHSTVRHIGGTCFLFFSWYTPSCRFLLEGVCFFLCD
jgi:hypothetical protein